VKPAELRRHVHDINAALATVLVFSGFLITYPELRAKTLGGFGHQVSDIHTWTGWAFVIVPLLALAVHGPALIANLKQRIFETQKTGWRKFHLCFSLALGVIFSITGVLMWWQTGIPYVVLDLAADVHLWLTWILCASVTVHIYNARRGIALRLRQYYRRSQAWLSALPTLGHSRAALPHPGVSNDPKP